MMPRFFFTRTDGIHSTLRDTDLPLAVLVKGANFQECCLADDFATPNVNMANVIPTLPMKLSLVDSKIWSIHCVSSSKVYRPRISAKLWSLMCQVSNIYCTTSIHVISLHRVQLIGWPFSFSFKSTVN